MARERRLGRLVNGDDEEASRDAAIEVPLPHASAPSGPLRLFTNRPFLWLVFGESFSMLARWGFFLALVGDATYRFDATPAQVGLLIGSYSLPLILVSPLYGTAADRWSGKWLLVLSSLTVMSVPIIAVTTSSLGGLFVAAVLYGLGYAAEMPARGALVPRLVGEGRLVQANGMITAASSVQMVIGPALGAVLTGVGGPTAPYFVSIVAGGLGALFFLPVPDRRRGTAAPRGGLFAEAADGLREAWRTPELRRLFSLGISVWFLIGLLISLEPIYVKGELLLGQDFLGLLWSVYGAGELAGSVILSRLRQGAGRELILVGRGLLLAGAGFLLYVAVPIPGLAIAGNVVFGIGFPFFVASSNALIQRVARFPGRVTAAFAMVGESGPVISALLLTAAGGAVSVRPWLLAAGLVFGAVAIVAIRVSRRTSVPNPA